MSKSANAGELRTPVLVVRIERTTDAEGYPVEVPVNVFGDNNRIMCKWVNAHGSDAYIAMQMQSRDPATVTCRYSPLITPDCLVYKGSDPEPFEIVGTPDNVEERNVWLEFKVQRREAAR
jgi:head-tail adaptor